MELTCASSNSESWQHHLGFPEWLHEVRQLTQVPTEPLASKAQLRIWASMHVLRERRADRVRVVSMVQNTQGFVQAEVFLNALMVKTKENNHCSLPRTYTVSFLWGWVNKTLFNWLLKPAHYQGSIAGGHLMILGKNQNEILITDPHDILFNYRRFHVHVTSPYNTIILNVHAGHWQFLIQLLFR